MVHEYILSTPLNTLPQEIRPSTHMNERYPSLRVMVGQTASGNKYQAEYTLISTLWSLSEPSVYP